jgi:hypothetical protein
MLGCCAASNNKNWFLKCDRAKCANICFQDNVPSTQSFLIDTHCFNKCCTETPNYCTKFNYNFKRYEDSHCMNQCLKYHPGNATITINNDL